MTDITIREQREKIIVKANALIEKSRFELSIQQQKIILYLISKISRQDTEFSLYDVIKLKFSLKESIEVVIPSFIISFSITIFFTIYYTFYVVFIIYKLC